MLEVRATFSDLSFDGCISWRLWGMFHVFFPDRPLALLLLE